MAATNGSRAGKATAVLNILPCQTSHEGPLDVPKQHWAPSQSEEGDMTAYFRGRKLQAKPISVPEGYRGVLVAPVSNDSTSKNQKSALLKAYDGLPSTASDDSNDVRLLQELDSFEEITVWGHNTLVKPADDPYMKGTQEWINLAESLHAYEEETLAERTPKNG